MQPIFGDQGHACDALSVYLQMNTTLTSLELNSNNIDYDGATALAEAIKENTSLTALHLRCVQCFSLSKHSPQMCGSTIMELIQNDKCCCCCCYVGGQASFLNCQHIHPL